MKLVIVTVLAFLVSIVFPTFGQSLKNRSTVGKEYAEEQVRLAILAGKHSKFPTDKPLLADKNIAITVAEPMLFNIYGKDNIMRQRPYEAYLVFGFWYVTGTLPKDSEGGTFEIIIEASTSRVIDVNHGN